MKKEQLAALIVAHLERCGVRWPGGPGNAWVRRIRSGRHQRAAGAASWQLMTVDESTAPSVLGFEPATAVAVAKVAYVSVELNDFVLNTGEPPPFGKWSRHPYGVSRVTENSPASG